MPGVHFPRSSRARRVLGAIALLVGTLTGTATVAQVLAAAYPTANVEIDGHGFGHGRGMGQYGALGYATEPDLQRDYAAILGHFYGNTSMGDIGNPTVTVILRKFDRRDTVVIQERGHLTTNAQGGTFRALRARRTGVNTFAVDRGDGCGGPWTEIHSGMTGPVVFAPQSRNEDRGEMVQVCEPNGVRWLRGEVRAVEGLDNTSRTVNALDMQGYLRGVVPRESPASWADRGGGAGIHALKAQAVAARSYAQSSDLAPYAKTCDTTACQVYGGRAFQDSSGFYDLEDGRSNRAVDETHGQVRVFGSGAVARTEYSSSTGGHTLPGAFPAVPDEGDRISPFHNWHVDIPASDVGSRYGVGTLNAVRVTERYGFGDWGGHAKTVVIEGSNGSRQVSGSDFQFEFGLRSDWFNVAGAAAPPAVGPGEPLLVAHSGKALDVTAGSRANGASVQQWTSHGGPNQRWAAEALGDGSYRIIAAHSGKVLDVTGVSTADGARIQQWDWVGGANQRWHLENLGDGTYKITSVHSGKVLDVEGPSQADGAPVHQWTWHGGPSQRWRGVFVVNGPAPGQGEPVQAVHSGKALDVMRASQANGTPVQQWATHGGANQRWRAEALGDGSYRIIAAHSGKVLDVTGVSTADGARIQQWDWVGGANQRWHIENLGDGTFKITSVHSGKVLDVTGVSQADGAPIQQWTWLAGANQKWRVQVG